MKKLIKNFLKFPFNKLHRLGQILQQISFNKINYIEFDLFPSDRIKYQKITKKILIEWKKSQDQMAAVMLLHGTFSRRRLSYKREKRRGTQ